MRILLSFFAAFFINIIMFSWVDAGFFDNFISGGTPEVRYCNDGDCGLQEWIDAIEGWISDIETDRTASEYIQDVVRYLLTFVSIVAVLYIIYAGFQILIWGWDEEKVKSSRQTIVYVIIGIILIWLAWPITLFILDILA